MKVLIDTNVWSDVANLRAGDDMSRAAHKGKKTLLIAPTVVEELRARPKLETRAASLQLATRLSWKRLMPDAYLESQELKAEIRRCRPQWMFENPRLHEVNRVRHDWVKKKNGYWDRMRRGEEDIVTDESLRRDNELQLARDQSYAIRQRIHRSATHNEDTHLQQIAAMPNDGTLGWNGAPVDYWRLPSLLTLKKELLVFASAHREWLDSEVDVDAMLYDEASMNQLWLHELDPARVPRQWLRGAFEFLQAWRRVTDGTPGDSALASFLVDADMVLSADKNFIRFAERCHQEAPFATARTKMLPGGEAGVRELITFLER